MSNLRRLAVAIVGALVATSANAALLLSVSYSKNFPFGPFLPNDSIEIVASVTNISPDQTITICEGVCIGDSYTYSFGGLASIPNGYSFYFGNAPAEAVFDGQIAGALLPGQEKDFIFGVYSPTAPASPGFYSFSAQLQIFGATLERPMLATSTFSGQWEVLDCKFPGGGATDGCFPGPGPFPAPEPGTLTLVVLSVVGGLAALVRRGTVE